MPAAPERLLLLCALGCSPAGAGGGEDGASEPPPLIASLAIDAPEATGVPLDPDDLRLMPDGQVVLLDRRLQQIILLSPELQATRTVGRPGDGPGEFRALAAALALPGDSLLAFDRRTQLFTVFGPDGQVARAFSWRPPEASPALPALLGGGAAPLVPVGRLDSGRLVATVAGPGTEPSARHQLLVFVGPADSGTPALLGAYPHTIPFVEGPARWGEILYSPEALVRVRGGAIVVGVTDAPELLAVSPGAGERALVHGLERERVSEADVRVARARRLERPSQLPPGATEARAMQVAAIERTPAASHRPAYGGLVVDPGGRAWLTVCDPLDPTRCEVEVVGAEGGRVARFRLPPSFQLHDVGPTSLVGIRDDPERGRVIEVRALSARP